VALLKETGSVECPHGGSLALPQGLRRLMQRNGNGAPLPRVETNPTTESTMKQELIVIANSTEARLFTRETDRDPLKPLPTLEQPDGHIKPSATGKDRPGHGGSDNHPGGVNFAPRMDPKRKRHLQFAHQLSQQVDHALASGECDRVSIFAACPFLGEFKGQLSPAATKALRMAVDLDLTSFGLSEIERRVAAELHAHTAAGLAT
jgi:protein required for attachment to host cells